MEGITRITNPCGWVPPGDRYGGENGRSFVGGLVVVVVLALLCRVLMGIVRYLCEIPNNKKRIKTTINEVGMVNFTAFERYYYQAQRPGIFLYILL